MKAPRRKPRPVDDQQPEVDVEQGQAGRLLTRAFSPEIMAKAAVARKPTARPIAC